MKTCSATFAFILSTVLLPGAGYAQTSLDSEESAFLTLLNNYRATNGAGPLTISPALSNSSRWMSNDMASKNYFSHTDSLGRDPGTRIAAFGYPYSWGENLAAGNATAQNTLNQFIDACDPDSTGACTFAHRNNMLNGGYKVIGIARAAGGTYGWYWTNDFGTVVDQPQGSAPVISAFAAAPPVLIAGQSTALWWTVSGASTIAIDNGVGDVTGSTIRVVTPSATTAYRLTATNASGSVSASVTVTVNPAPTGDTQPPTAPAITSAIAAGPNEVDLTWTGSTDNVAVVGYQIIRNGSAVASVPPGARSWADTGTLANSTYTYTVKAFDAASNYSAASNAVTVTTPAPPVTSTCPPPSFTAFTGCYFDNVNLSGNPVLVRTDTQINFDWAGTTPAPVVPPAFSVRWQGNFYFAQGNYTFTATVSDGIRVDIDGNVNPIIDRWMDHPLSRYTVQVPMTAGGHLITVEYYERTGTGAAHLSWQPDPGTPAAPVISSFAAVPPTITAGQGTTLSWSVSGADTITIDNGVGDVTGTTLRTVSPSATTTYRLTAVNSSGTTVGTVTVSVNAPPTPDTQPPTAPVITAATAKSATEVDLTWTASIDNVGVAGYQILRNGTAVASVPGSTLHWADTSVVGNTTYVYTVRAFDAAGNYSVASNTAAVTTPAPPVPSACPAPAVNAFTGCWFGNIGLSGDPVLVRTDSQINFDWAGTTPGPTVPAAFSVRWQGSFDFQAATYTFTALTSDGIRVYIDGNPFPALDRWSDHPPYRFLFQAPLTAGRHLITVEYYEQTGTATAHLSWQ